MKLRSGKTINKVSSQVNNQVPAIIKTTPPHKPNFTPICIGEGAYGKVFKVSPTEIRKDSEYLEKILEGVFPEFCQENISEALFLTRYKAPFIPAASSVRIRDKTISIVERYSGPSLVDTYKKLKYSQRIELLPTLMCQMGRILMWMKRHHIVHMDIKPGNLCLDSENNLTLIDWGFIGIPYFNADCYNGTEQCADPAYLQEVHRINYAYDMFGMGMTLYSFLTKSYVDVDDWTAIMDKEDRQEQVWELLDMDDLATDIIDILPKEIGTKIANILRKMLTLEVKDRITPTSLYTNSVFRDLWEKYPLHTGDDRVEKTPEIDYHFQSDIKQIRVERLSDKIMEITKSLKLTQEVGLVAIKLMHTFLSKVLYNHREHFLMHVGCIYLASCITHGQIKLSSLAKVVETEIREESSDSIYAEQDSRYEFVRSVSYILQGVEWDFYPSTSSDLLYASKIDRVVDIYESWGPAFITIPERHQIRQFHRAGIRL